MKRLDTLLGAGCLFAGGVVAAWAGWVAVVATAVTVIGLALLWRATA